MIFTFMIGSYTLTQEANQLKDRFDVDVVEAYKPTFNASPTQLLPVITNEEPRGISFFYWGATPKMANNRTLSKKLLTVDAEELPHKSSHRNAMRSRRCLIPADGYYEWKRVSKKGRTPHWVFFKDHQSFAMAGLWDEYEDEDGENHHTFKLITVTSNDILGDSVERMPAIISKEEESLWLSEINFDDYLKQLKTSPSTQMETFSVSPKISDPQNNFPELVKHVPPADQFGNYTLFN